MKVLTTIAMTGSACDDSIPLYRNPRRSFLAERRRDHHGEDKKGQRRIAVNSTMTFGTRGRPRKYEVSPSIPARKPSPPPKGKTIVSPGQFKARYSRMRHPLTQMSRAISPTIAGVLGKRVRCQHIATGGETLEFVSTPIKSWTNTKMINAPIWAANSTTRHNSVQPTVAQNPHGRGAKTSLNEADFSSPAGMRGAARSHQKKAHRERSRNRWSSRSALVSYVKFAILHERLTVTLHSRYSLVFRGRRYATSTYEPGDEFAQAQIYTSPPAHFPD